MELYKLYRDSSVLLQQSWKNEWAGLSSLFPTLTRASFISFILYFQEILEEFENCWSIHWFFLNSSKQESFTESVTKRVRDMEGRERVWDRWAVLDAHTWKVGWDFARAQSWRERMKEEKHLWMWWWLKATVCENTFHLPTCLSWPLPAIFHILALRHPHEMPPS